MIKSPSPPLRRGRPPKTGRTDTRAALIAYGTQLLTEQGFLNTGIEQVLKQHGIPKGSFYHYFPSKEAFGYAVIDNYGDYFARKLDRCLTNIERAPLRRIADFIADAKAGMTRYDFRRGCLIGNLGQELAGSHDGFRQHLETIFVDWQRRLAKCLDEAVAAGELPAGTDCQRLARFFWVGWEGAVLRAKLVKSCDPLDLFAEFFFAALTGNPAPLNAA
jgi:TetR/AcrR family transcriptional repressor of nem operon